MIYSTAVNFRNTSGHCERARRNENRNGEGKDVRNVYGSSYIIYNTSWDYLYGIQVELADYLLGVTKKQLKTLAKKYEDAYNFVLNGYERWKRLAVMQDLQEKKNNSYTQDFARCVVEIAEMEEPEKKAPKKQRTLSYKNRIAHLMNEEPCHNDDDDGGEEYCGGCGGSCN